MITQCKIKLPDLTRAAHAVRDMRPVVVVSRTPEGGETIQALQARIRELEAEKTQADQAAARKAQRLDYLNARTLRIVDRRAAWRAKQPGRHQPVVTITPRRIEVLDVWQPAAADD